MSINKMKHDYSAYTDIIRSRISAEELARDYGIQTGRDGRCRCIFCEGARDDTLKMYPGDRGYFCFRCHERGDVISLYRKLTGAGFTQAVRDLNDQYGIGLPLDGGDEKAIEKAKREAEERKRRRAEEQAKKRKLFEDWMDAADAVDIMEQNKVIAAPKTRDEPWRQRFVIALKYLDEMKDYRDSLFDELYGEF